MKFNFRLNTNSISFFRSLFFSFFATGHTLQTDNGISLGIRCWKLLFCVLFILSYLSLSPLACLSWISDLVFGFYRSSITTYLNQVRNARGRSFSARFPDHDVISACMHQRDDRVRREAAVSHLLHTCSWKARASWRGRLSRVSCSNGCRVRRRRSCCSLYHRDLGGINRETRLFDRDQFTRILEMYLLHRVTSVPYPKRLILIERTYEFKEERRGGCRA